MNQESRSTLAVAAAAALLMAITMGSRSSFGLFVSPLNSATGLGLVTISFAAAMNQLMWGFAQPFAGFLSERFGAARVIAAGSLLLAAGTALIPFAHSGAGLVFGFSLIAIAGAAAGSNGILLGEVSRRVSAERRGLAVGFVGAGGSVGQLVLGPGSQTLIAGAGWEYALFALALLALAGVPLALPFLTSSHAKTPVAVRPGQPAAELREALASRPFWCVSAAFFVCGFHVSFLVAHMPGVIELCGLPPGLSGWWLGIIGVCNVIGSIAAGAAIRRGSMRQALMGLYVLRALGVACFIALPRSELTVLAFAVWMGLTYMATLPPTVGLIGRLFGLQHLATLLGVVMLVHQLGAFLGVWLGGITVDATGSYDAIWYADIALALIAAALHLPVREVAQGGGHTSTDSVRPVRPQLPGQECEQRIGLDRLVKQG